jgi:hypothetical protein
MEPYTDAKMDARKYLYEKYLKESDPSANRNLKPERNLHSPEAMAEAGYTPPQRYTAPEEKEEPGLLTKAWNALFGDSEEDIKAQQFNNAQYQKGLAEGKASASSPGKCKAVSSSSWSSSSCLGFVLSLFRTAVRHSDAQDVASLD